MGLLSMSFLLLRAFKNSTRIWAAYSIYWHTLIIGLYPSDEKTNAKQKLLVIFYNNSILAQFVWITNLTNWPGTCCGNYLLL